MEITFDNFYKITGYSFELLSTYYLLPEKKIYTYNTGIIVFTNQSYMFIYLILTRHNSVFNCFDI